MNPVSAITLILKPEGPATEYSLVWWLEKYTKYSLFAGLGQIVCVLAGLLISLVLWDKEYYYITSFYGFYGLV